MKENVRMAVGFSKLFKQQNSRNAHHDTRIALTDNEAEGKWTSPTATYNRLREIEGISLKSTV